MNLHEPHNRPRAIMRFPYMNVLLDNSRTLYFVSPLFGTTVCNDVGPLNTQFVNIMFVLISCWCGPLFADGAKENPDKRAAVSLRVCLESRIYSSATALLFHLPCRFKVNEFAPLSASTVADVTRSA